MNRRKFLGITAGGMASMLSGTNTNLATSSASTPTNSKTTTHSSSEQITRWIKHTPYPLAVPDKAEQIKATGADYCIAGCHNCHAQIHELSEHYGGNYPVVHLWTLICLSLGILGPNEREYLGDDLKEVNVFHPETAM